MSTIVCPSSAPSRAQPHPARQPGAWFALTIPAFDLVSLLLCVFAFSGWLAIESGALPCLAVVFFALLVLSIYYLGRLVLQMIFSTHSLAPSFALIFLTGSLSWALIMLGLHSLLPGSLSCHLLLLLAFSAGGQGVIPRRQRPAGEERRAARMSLFIVFFSLAAATCWARGLLHPTTVGENRVTFHHWMDYFDHASFTAQLLAPEHLWRFGNYEISGLPAPLYHYGSYLFTASLASFSSLSAYDAVIAFWTPFGTFLSGLAAYVLATSLGGRLAGMSAVIALLSMPDASYYGLHNPWFRYHWLQQIGSAGLYGSACAALAVVFLLEARQRRSPRILLCGLAFGTATFFFKAQLFIVLMPLLLSWLILCYPRFSVAWRMFLLLAVAGTALGGILLSNHLHLGPRLEPNREYFEHYCKYAVGEGDPGIVRDTVEKGAADLGRSRYYVVATSAIVLSTFGGLIVVLPLLCLWAWRQQQLHPLDLVPWIALTVYVVLLVGLKDNIVGVNWWELIHRPFVWPYFVLMVWCAGKGCLLLRATRLGQGLLTPQLIAAAGLLSLALPWHMGLHAQQGKMSWRGKCYDVSFERGLLDCGRFLAANSSRSDLVQDAHQDPFLVLGSLSERRSYLARPDLWKESKNPLVRDEIKRRRALLEEFQTATTRAALQEMAARTGIRWYLLHPDDRVDWPKEVLSQPAFCSEGFAVYDLLSRASLPRHADSNRHAAEEGCLKPSTISRGKSLPFGLPLADAAGASK